jgi:hypothetical protein
LAAAEPLSSAESLITITDIFSYAPVKPLPIKAGGAMSKILVGVVLQVSARLYILYAGEVKFDSNGKAVASFSSYPMAAGGKSSVLILPRLVILRKQPFDFTA